MFAYSTILAFQLKVIWGLWLYSDLETGDSVQYMLSARMWHERGLSVMSWSPLYTIFLGGMFNLTSDAYFATVAHRLIIILTLAVLVLALMRQLLAPPIAWLAAAWWCVLPINFDAVYSIHLFALIPILLAPLAVAWWPGSTGRGICLAILAGTAVLMRNEIAIPCVLFAGVCLIYEIHTRLRAAKPFPWWKPLVQYAIPCLLVAGICGLLYLKADDRGRVWGGLRSKAAMNMCQGYATSYQQRHPEWTPNPYLECPSLMEKLFGTRDLVFSEAFVRNPIAILDHIAWNYSLVPNGVQVMLFNAMSGTIDPDYRPVNTARVPVLMASALLIAIWIFGAIRIRRRWSYWYATLFRPRAAVWGAALIVVSVSAVIIATHRPRPSYLFSLSVLLMALTGVCVQAILGRGIRSRWMALGPVLVVVLIVVTPRYFYAPAHRSNRPVMTAYEVLKPFTSQLSREKPLITPATAAELCHYFDQAYPMNYCSWLNYYELGPQASAAALNQSLAAKKVRFFYVNEDMLAQPPVTDFVATAKGNGWEAIGMQLAPGNRWMLFERLP